ncbi:hypothetical protein TNCV_2777701 [Trichonephila clavipes]|nr:hypothetical protein TNCV_2777701 [Trichonephila clavipes]
MNRQENRRSREVTTDTLSIADRRGNSIDLRVKVLRIIGRFDGQRRGRQSDHRFHKQGGRQVGSRNGAFREQFNLFTDASGVRNRCCAESKAQTYCIRVYNPEQGRKKLYSYSMPISPPNIRVL